MVEGFVKEVRRATLDQTVNSRERRSLQTTAMKTEARASSIIDGAMRAYVAFAGILWSRTILMFGAPGAGTAPAGAPGVVDPADGCVFYRWIYP